ncbi:class A beta-lactamase [Legionella longbeachae]|uniref:Beta-lactamase n=1 Tax=Legionella longbeachae serogroup 1 (strain NSW150) TaxID=661367 RepID=D3HM63_LEGLN|nr:class A beta-lactamase [Legionella longbeachae]VEE03975.1 beta-lactamase [Legionella oakridgensis]HBD7397243.1 class A beta-lactamase [Legionella pneumophila]ARB93168.1 serine hydrolase [Legionella longbeachae]ARM33768.1 class A beta-lactamase [Legionella longbeachae]EEZ97071.1 beta-lactamase [Legionella longbeachae D-4968]
MKIKFLTQFVDASKIKSRLQWIFLGLIFSFDCFAAHNNDIELSRRISAIEKNSRTVMGITAIHIEKNKIISHNSNQRFFMASTVKLPIALAFLHRVDENKESLDRVIKMDTKNSVPGSGSLHHIFEKKKLNMSLKQVLIHMMRNSDNSASDTILKVTNGPKYVASRMSALGFKNIFVNRSILEMFLDTNHVNHSYLKKPQPVFSWQKLFDHVPLEEKKLAWQRFQNDTRDTTTSEDMAKLLVKLYKKQALSESNTKLLIDIMEKCRTGRSRIKGLLPAHVKVAHKTGTWSIYEQDYLRYPGSKNLYRFVSDVGIITLPNNKGHIALAVYVKSQSASDYPRSRAIALASRAIYDHFMNMKSSNA